MTDNNGRRLDAATLAMFATKGMEGGPNIPQVGLSNGVKVRRVLQLTRDFAQKPFHELKILDLGCGEGVYSIEAALQGAQVLAIDARTVRMQRGAALAERLGLTQLRFVQEDVRRATRASLGGFDTVYFLGLLYHLDTTDIFKVLEAVAELCDHVLIIDTLVSLQTETSAEWRGTAYAGTRMREHGDDDPADVRASKPLKSIDNTFSFRFTRAALTRVLLEVGFTSVVEAHAPLEADKAEDRVTLVAIKGQRTHLSTYPWVNDKSEVEIAEFLTANAATGGQTVTCRAEWKPGPPIRPLAPEHLLGSDLLLAVHGPGSDGLKRSHHDDIADDPYYAWSGKCAGPWAVSFSHRSQLLNLSAGGRVRWRAKQSGAHCLRLIIETAAGDWFVSEQCDAACDTWREFELNLDQATWQALDIDTVTASGTSSGRPSLAAVRSFGVTDLTAGAGSEGCSRLVWMEIQGLPVVGYRS